MSFLYRYFVLCTLFFNTAFAQEFDMLQYGERSERYSIFIPAKKPDSCELVLFLHGHGATNASVYGSWIRHLLESGKIVVFPKYQPGGFIPTVAKPQERIEKALLGAIDHLRSDRKIALKKVHVIGHSLGGALGANIVATTKLPAGMEFSTLALIEPGSWVSKSGRLKSYNTFPPGLRLMCITGSRDWVAEKRFARFVTNNTPQLPQDQKIHFEITRHFHKKQFINSTHFDPAGTDMEFDTHSRDLLVWLAKAVCGTDLTDERAFWFPVDRLMNEAQKLDDCGDLGAWSDGTPIGKLQKIQQEQ